MAGGGHPADGAGAAPRARGLAWDWSGALLGLVFSLPAAAVALDDVTRGVAFAVGVVPPAVVGVLPRRRDRRVLAGLGVLVGAPIVVGAVVAGVPVVAVAVLFSAAVGAVMLAQRSRFGTVAVSLSLPMIGVGLSFTGVGSALGLALIMVAGSVYASLISMLWPERPPAPPPARPAVVPTSTYGLLLGGAGATAAAIGFALDLDHVGWACAAALLVMRPSAEMQQLRSVGRIVSVALGAAAAIGVVRLDPADAWFSLAVVAVVATVGATHRSRWYITSAFTTFLVFVLLLDADPAEAASRFNERLGETLLGVALACAYGLVIPRAAGLRTTAARSVPLRET